VKSARRGESAMSTDNNNLDLELASLMCSRVCHDVINPVGAIINGLEVLEDEDDEEMRNIAKDLIQKSATQASARLQFARLAFGASGSAGSVIDCGDAKDAVMNFFDDDKVEIDWQVPHENKPKDEVKLIMALVLIGRSTIPRGGRISVLYQNGAINVVCGGDGAKLPEQSQAMVERSFELEGLDARSVQLYLAYRLAQVLDYKLDFSLDGEKVELAASPNTSDV
jgi:histidine phosphotransferase ChpT